jgi:ATP dependent DNA ligase domain
MQVHIFSRHCEDKTAMFPDVARALLFASHHAAAPMTPDLHKSREAHLKSLSSEGSASARAAPAKSFIIDSELVAVDRAQNNRLRVFQELSTRARGGADAVQEADVTVHVCVFLFDLLYIDGEDLLHLPFRERRRRLAAAFPGRRPGHVALAEGMELSVVAEGAPAAEANGAASVRAGNASSKAVRAAAVEEDLLAVEPGAATGAVPAADGAPHKPSSASQLQSEQQPRGVATAAEPSAPLAPPAPAAPSQAAAPPCVTVSTGAAADLLEQQLLRAVAEGTEGLMLKFLDGPRSAYQPSKRSDSWLKVKKDYCENLRDSLDLVRSSALCCTRHCSVSCADRAVPHTRCAQPGAVTLADMRLSCCRLARLQARHRARSACSLVPSHATCNASRLRGAGADRCVARQRPQGRLVLPVSSRRLGLRA